MDGPTSVHGYADVGREQWAWEYPETKAELYHHMTLGVLHFVRIEPKTTPLFCHSAGNMAF